MTIWDSDDEFFRIKDLLYEDLTHPKDAEWVRVPDHNKELAVGFIYNKEHNYFHPPQPFPSWTLNHELQRWKAPIEEPGPPYMYMWNEEKLEWDITGIFQGHYQSSEEYIDNLLESIENGVIA